MFIQSLAHYLHPRRRALQRRVPVVCHKAVIPRRPTATAVSLCWRQRLQRRHRQIANFAVAHVSAQNLGAEQVRPQLCVGF